MMTMELYADLQFAEWEKEAGFTDHSEYNTIYRGHDGAWVFEKYEDGNLHASLRCPFENLPTITVQGVKYACVSFDLVKHKGRYMWRAEYSRERVAKIKSGFRWFRLRERRFVLTLGWGDAI